METRERLEDYFKMKDRIEPIITEILNENESIKDINIDKYIPVRTNRKDIELIYQIIKYLKNEEEYLKMKPKMENAVFDYIRRKLFPSEEKSTSEIAEIHRVPLPQLRLQISKSQRYREKDEKYEYDMYIYNSSKCFSYCKETMLLRTLDLEFIDKDLLPCPCRICHLIHLSTLAYEFATKYKLWYPHEWDKKKKTDTKWLEEFEMRHSKRLAEMSRKDCILPRNNDAGNIRQRILQYSNLVFGSNN